MNQRNRHENEAGEMPEKMMNAFCREVLRAGAAREDVIAAAAESPFLQQRIRARIAAEAETRAAAKPIRGWLAARLAELAGSVRPRWGVAAAAVVLALLAWNWIRAPRDFAPPTHISAPVLPKDLTHAMPHAPDPAPAKAAAKRARRVRRAEEPEILTAFLPLTVVPQDNAQESGQIVRVEAPRSALLALGLPVQFERTTDTFKADVFVGDDGLARAIRFVR